MLRLIDVFLSLLGIALLSPFLGLIIFILRCSSEGEVFYLQRRIGFKGKEFRIFKFASMIKDSPNIGAGTLTMKNDPRVFPFGGFLRKTKLNELPQLLNILNGDMSIVGPRPLLPDGEHLYSPADRTIIRSIRPGVTGIGSLILRDEEGYYAYRADAHEFYRTILSPYKAQLEVWYVERKSFWLDMKIIVLTLLAVLRPKADLDKFFKGLPKKPSALKFSE
jgi:lipopolysaccharide/colanic/teichoic acid biosynthesis glycosyltransferase